MSQPGRLRRPTHSRAFTAAALAACRQLVTRARTHVRRRAPRFTPDRGQHAGAVEAFLTACSHGSVEELVRVLDPDVVLRSDGGGLVPGVARRPVTGSDDVARLVVGVMGFTVAGNLITEIDFVVNPETAQDHPPLGGHRRGTRTERNTT